MRTTVIVVIGIWNGLLLAGLLTVIIRRKQVLEWITGIDHWNRNQWDSGGGGDDAWTAFLAAHPELRAPRLQREAREG